MEPVADGLIADVDIACFPRFTAQYICGGCSVAKGREDNTSVLLPGCPVCLLSDTLLMLVNRSHELNIGGRIDTCLCAFIW